MPGWDYPPDIKKDKDLNIEGCDASVTGGGGGYLYMDNPSHVTDTLKENIFPLFQAYAYEIIVKVNLFLFASLFVLASSLRWCTAIFGAEVDISSLARLM